MSVAAVRDLHRVHLSEYYGFLYCAECSTGDLENVPYPCATIRALDGAE